MKRRVTLSDVARSANVSVATVSRVASRAGSGSPEVVKRVKKAAAELGFDLLRQNKSRVVGFLLSNRENLHPFHSRVLVGAEDYCARNGYSLVFCLFRYALSAGWQELHLPRFSERRQSVDGFIVGGTNSQSLLQLLSHKRFPFVVLGNNVVGQWPQQDYDAVWTDDIQGAYEATCYLQSLSHQEIAYIGNSRLPWFLRCGEGYKRAMIEASLPLRIGDFNSENTQEVGYVATRSILRSGRAVSAIVAGDTLTASGAYRALRDCRLRIPDDVSVVGIGEVGADMLEPPLTRVREFPEQVGSELARLLLKKLDNPDLLPQQVIVPTRLVKSESCGRPPTRVDSHASDDKASRELPEQSTNVVR